MSASSCSLSTPIGWLRIEEQAGKLCSIRRAEGACFEETEGDTPVLQQAKAQLEAYFAGERIDFDLPIEAKGTAFEQAVWQELAKIPFAEVRSYGAIARVLGKPDASRAVGRACGRNPLLIVIPCHRVVASSGRLTGFAAGLDAKRILLELEGFCIRNEYVKNETQL